MNDHLTAALSDRYRIERELGRGGMATVYLARDLKQDRLVALKVLHPEVAGTLVGEQRFLREVRTAATLQHPHILPLFDSGQSGGKLWYTMPFVEGESLRARLGREIQLPIEEALRIARDVAEALEYAHGQGVLHRDIKPENVLLSPGHALVADFGIARALGLAGGERLTETGIVVGTPAYMSPEQASGQHEVDARTDVYSLGCVLYEMLAGEPPFTGPTPQAVISKRFLQSVLPLRQLRPTVSAAVDQAVEKALARVPADRFATAGEFSRALTAAANASSAVAPAPVAESTPSPLREPVSPLIALTLYVLAALAVLGTVHLISRTLGLPDWIVPGALVLLLIGLPIILTTAVVQGRRSTGGVLAVHPGRRRRLRWLTWRRALAGGVLAFAGLGLAGAGYMVLRALGVGPVGTLLAAGQLRERERLLVADFKSPPADTVLGGVVTEAFRIDLAQSPAVTVMPPSQVAEVLTRMKRPTGLRLDPALAREIAIREGMRAVVTGEIARAGSQYVISAQLVSAPTGEVLAARRETAGDSTRLIQTVDRLSRKLRERIGESLKTIRRDPPLERVTTGSLDALQKYVLAMRAGDHEADQEKAVALLEEAVTLDSAFAMAYRALGIYLSYTGDWDRAIWAYRKALAHRDRLTQRERYLMLADYEVQVNNDLEKGIAAYSVLLETYPDDRQALNNLGVTYRDLGQFDRAEPLLQRALVLDSLFWQPYWNLVWVQVGLGKRQEAERTYQRLVQRVPDNPRVDYLAALLSSSARDYPAAERHARLFKERHGAVWDVQASSLLAQLAAVRGRLSEAERHSRDVMALSAEAGSAVGYLQGASALGFIAVRLRGDPAAALKELGRALRRYPLDSIPPADRPYVLLATMYALAGRPDRARTLLTELERVVPPAERRGWREAYRRGAWGYVAMAEGRLQDAVPDLRAWARGAGGGCMTCGLPELARVYEQLGQTDSAVTIYERYVTMPDLWRHEIDPGELQGAFLRLGELYERLGEREKASEYYSRFIELWKDCDPELRPRVADARRRLAALMEG